MAKARPDLRDMSADRRVLGRIAHGPSGCGLFAVRGMAPDVMSVTVQYRHNIDHALVPFKTFTFIWIFNIGQVPVKICP